MKEKRYFISDAAKEMEVESHVLRYWEEELNLDIPRNEMGHRYYREDELEMLKCVKELKARGVQTAVVSNKADFAVKTLAAEYFPALLQEAVGENESAGIAKKPAPDSLLAVMKNLNAEKGATVYVGDSEVDIQTAENAGVDCISVVWGFKDEAFLKANGAKTLIKEPFEILDFCKESI